MAAVGDDRPGPPKFTQKFDPNTPCIENKTRERPGKDQGSKSRNHNPEIKNFEVFKFKIIINR